MSNAKRFIAVHNQIERHLRRELRQDTDVSYSDLIVRAARKLRVVNRYQQDLREYAHLRNAIVHSQDRDKVIAEPVDEAVKELEEIARIITEPPKVYPEFRAEVHSVESSDTISQALGTMKRLDYSQLPVLEQGRFVSLLTANTIARWLAACVEEGLGDIAATQVGNVQDHIEFVRNYEFISRDTPIAEAVHIFESAVTMGRIVDALLITESGKPNQKIIGIITAWDLPRAYGKITI